MSTEGVPTLPEGILDEILAGGRATLPEETFFNRYLPLTVHSDPNLFAQLWLIEVVKNFSQEVDIIDNNGTVLYTVPPLAAPMKVRTSEELFSMLTESTQYANIAPIVQLNFLNANLPNMVQTEPGDVDELRTRWAKIFERYNGLAIAKAAGFAGDAPESKTTQSIGASFGDD